MQARYEHIALGQVAQINPRLSALLVEGQEKQEPHVLSAEKRFLFTPTHILAQGVEKPTHFLIGGTMETFADPQVLAELAMTALADGGGCYIYYTPCTPSGVCSTCGGTGYCHTCTVHTSLKKAHCVHRQNN